jgi:hypothetical protein
LYRERPSCCRGAEQRYELAPFQSIELHTLLPARKLVTAYRIGEDQSGGPGIVATAVDRQLTLLWLSFRAGIHDVLFPRRASPRAAKCAKDEEIGRARRSWPSLRSLRILLR